MKKLLLGLTLVLGLALSNCTPSVDTGTVYSQNCSSTYSYYYYYYDSYGYAHYYMQTYNVYKDAIGCYILYYNYGTLMKHYI